MNETGADAGRGPSSTPASVIPLAFLAWLWVLIPFGYGMYQLFSRIPALFGG